MSVQISARAVWSMLCVVISFCEGYKSTAKNQEAWTPPASRLYVRGKFALAVRGLDQRSNNSWQKDGTYVQM